MNLPRIGFLPSNLAAFLVLLLAAVLARAQTPAQAKPGDTMFDHYLAQETAKLSKRTLDGATTREQWEARRPRLRQEYLEMLGLWPLPEKTPLHVKVTGLLEQGGVVVEKLHFQSRPGLYVTGDLYRPKKIQGKLPAVLYVCGHSGRGRDGNKTAFQDHGLWFGSNGYVCLIIDTLQLGEIPGIHHGTYDHGRWWWQAAGYTPAGVECWNGIRALDYLASRADVDAGRMAVTGISGGGASMFWIAAADERVRCAVPVSGMSDLESYVSHKVINGHCDCMLLINTYAWEWTTIAALVAPRPLLFCNSDHDPIFPMDGNERIITRLRLLYELYGKPELVDAYVSRGGHDYRPDLRLAIFKWINKHIKNDTGPVKDADFKLIGRKELRAFPEDKDIPADARNGKIDETFVPRAEVHLPEPAHFATWKNDLLQKLRQHSFRPFPLRIPQGSLSGSVASASGVTRLQTEAEIAVTVVNARNPAGRSKQGTLIVVNPEENLKGAPTIPNWAQALLGDGAVFVMAPRGVGLTAWTPKSPPNYVERSHALLGRTVDQGRVWDIAASVRYLDTEGKRNWKVVGRGQAGILAAYAALFEPAIAEVVAVDPPKSHRQGPIFLNVLRVLDIPEALGLLAPKPLSLLNAQDKAFDKTVKIYEIAGARTMLQRK